MMTDISNKHNSSISVAWVLVNNVHYHHARFTAFASELDKKPALIEVSGRDDFDKLRRDVADNELYTWLTLFPDASVREIRRSMLEEKLFQALDRLRPDVVCVNGWEGQVAHTTLSWCTSRDVPAILMSDSQQHDKHRWWLVEKVKKKLIQLYSSALVAGQSHVKYVEKLGMDSANIFTGYDVVENTHFSSTPRSAVEDLRRDIGIDRLVFMAASRFTPKKNLFRLATAFSRYREKAQNPWDLVILGDGPQKEELLRSTRQLGIGQHVHFPGFVSYEQLPIYYGLASAFVHASTTEQWGLVVNEAMAAGLPVLVSERCGCAPDLIEEGQNGFTFNPYDIDALADLMLFVANPGCDRDAMSEKSRKIISRWTTETFAHNLMHAVQAAVKAQSGPPRVADRILLKALSYR